MFPASNDARKASDAPAAGGDSLLRTKLFVPPRRSIQVGRPRLIEKFNGGLDKALILVSAPAGFGKTTAVAEWVAGGAQPVAWLSLDEGDNDPIRFLTYFIAALQTIEPALGSRIAGALRSTQPPATEWVLTDLLNEITGIPRDFVIILDDYHGIESAAVDSALAFLLEHQPAHMHLVIATREDPRLPLAQLRASDRLTELRAADLRFTASEAAEFLNNAMGLTLSAEDIDALEARTEGWIAGLQLAALSMQGIQDKSAFIKSFSGSHRFVLDYLLEEVLGQQPKSIQNFLLHTSILERMCAPLCQAVLPADSAPAQEILEHLERANLFVVPLDNERHWYRYHHLFAELLRQRMHQSALDIPELHRRASQWYEDNGLDIEAFRHAGAANDIELAERLIDAKGLDTQQPGVAAITAWITSLPREVLDARPSLWVRHASALLVAGQTTAAEEMLQSAEAALRDAPPDEETRDLHGQIAAGRAMVAVGHYDVETILEQASLAEAQLHRDSWAARFRASVARANAHEIQQDRAALGRAYAEALAIARASGSVLHIGVATIGLGEAQEFADQLHAAADNYREAIGLLADQQVPILSYAHLGLGRILREWNELEAAEEQIRKAIQLARQYDRDVDVFVICEVVLAHLALDRGDAAGASAILDEADQAARQRNFTPRMPEIAAARVRTLLQQGNLAQAARVSQQHEIPLSRARVHLAQGNAAAALAELDAFRQRAEARDWQDERLRAMILQAVALRAHGDKDKALQVLGEALGLAEPGGFIRSFVDEGAPLAELLAEAAGQGVMPGYTGKLLTAFAAEQREGDAASSSPPAQSLIEPLSQRELEILRLVAQGLSNQEISQRLFLALSTVKGHNRVIFNKLQVQRRTEAVARARELGLLQPEHPGR